MCLFLMYLWEVEVGEDIGMNVDEVIVILFVELVMIGVWWLVVWWFFV